MGRGGRGGKDNRETESVASLRGFRDSNYERQDDRTIFLFASLVFDEETCAPYRLLSSEGIVRKEITTDGTEGIVGSRWRRSATRCSSPCDIIFFRAVVTFHSALRARERGSEEAFERRAQSAERRALPVQFGSICRRETFTRAERTSGDCGEPLGFARFVDRDYRDYRESSRFVNHH